MPRANKKVLGLMKDEQRGRIMTEFVGLGTKMHTCKVERKDVTKKIKGLTRPAITRITFNDLKDCLVNQNTKSEEPCLIRSKKHTIYTIKQNKLALSSYDDERNISLNSTDTKPWGFNFHNQQPNRIVIPNNTMYWMALNDWCDYQLISKLLSKKIRLD
ncbi:hypothetical protein NQ315_012887 [Exocentrus adspersus]|uniref:Uncharacterized protein n=1 Tax=Exocentrus adspersus TaxID=1586481 RepID=A0AAV8VGG1_9CUCU|nr:hypothetical protein NQ315_012887 [Exocentrus adspersus]